MWGELVDVSPMIDVVKLEEYFATKQTVKEISKPTNTPEKKNYLDSKRSQNIGQLSVATYRCNDKNGTLPSAMVYYLIISGHL